MAEVELKISDAQPEKPRPGEDPTASAPVESKREKKRCPIYVFLQDKAYKMCKVMYVMTAVLIMIFSITCIAAAVTTCIATKIYNEDQSSRLVALIVLCVTAAISFTVAIASSAAALKQNKHVKSLSALLIIMAIIQGLICGFSVRVTDEDQLSYSMSIARTFRQSQIEGNKFGKLWDTTQSELQCCGVYSPEDYRDARRPYYLPPDVPVSCCTTYDRSRSNLVQERERETCLLKKNYYAVGCKDKMVDVLVVTAQMVIGVTAVLIVLELLLSIWGIIKAAKESRRRRKHEDAEDTNNNK